MMVRSCRIVVIVWCMFGGARALVAQELHVADTNGAASDADVKTAVAGRTAQQALRLALPFLARDGRAWMDGEIAIQDTEGCVSCHQVPTAIWSQAAARLALLNEPTDGPASDTKGLGRLIQDATDHISDPKIGRAAMWAQLLAARPLYRELVGKETLAKQDAWTELILSRQGEDGLWQAKGQFPNQRRPVPESNEVVTMWMMLGLTGGDWERHTPIAAAVNSGLDRLNQQTSAPRQSVEWLAMRTVIAERLESRDKARELELQLVERQNDDGSWGWLPNEPGDPYSTGVALFALSKVSSNLEQARSARADAQSFLVSTQNDDGTWSAASHLFSNGPSERVDYVYHYWATAWAALGLAAHLG